MRIALDFDGTYTRDPFLWEVLIGAAEAAGHDIRIVTSRHPEHLPDVKCKAFCTGMRPKGQFVAELGWVPDVWIDDHPERIYR